MRRAEGTRRKSGSADSDGESRCATPHVLEVAAEPPTERAGPEPALADRAVARVHPEPASLVDPLDRQVGQPGASGVERAGILVDDRQDPARPEHPPRARPGRRRSSSGARRPRPRTPRRMSTRRTGAGAPRPGRAGALGPGQHRGRAVEPDHLGPGRPQVRGEPPLAASEVEETAARQGFEAFPDGAEPAVSLVDARLEPGLEPVESVGDHGLVRDRSWGPPRPHSLAVLPVADRHRDARQAQKTKPSRPSRNPALPR